MLIRRCQWINVGCTDHWGTSAKFVFYFEQYMVVNKMAHRHWMFFVDTIWFCSVRGLKAVYSLRFDHHTIHCIPFSAKRFYCKFCFLQTVVSKRSLNGQNCSCGDVCSTRECTNILSCDIKQWNGKHSSYDVIRWPKGREKVHDLEQRLEWSWTEKQTVDIRR